jgi:glycosyltransferase involved in cell wall biosynthesis
MISVVAPVYNEERTVDELVKRVGAACSSLGDGYEIVLVDDGSRDNTLARILMLMNDEPRLRAVKLGRNFGYSAAQTAGLTSARGEAVILMDGDLQDPPEVIPSLVEAWRGGSDVVYAIRSKRDDALAMKVAARLYYWVLARISETRIPEQSGTFSLLDRHIVDTLNRLPERTRYFVGLRAWAGGRQTELAYEREKRFEGRSRLALRGRVDLARQAFVSFSKVPLRLASALSMLTALVLLGVGIFAIVVRLFVPQLALPGWAATTVLIGAMGFVQSLLLAALAEYLAVVFDEVKGRPLYIVEAEYSSADGAPEPS